MTGMTYDVLANGDLRIFFAGTHQERADQQSGLLAERSDMGADADLFGTDDNMCEVFESLVCNSELDWVDPKYTGCLTDAPMLAIFGADKKVTKKLEEMAASGSLNISGCDGKNAWYTPIAQCWAFMDYQVTSPQDVLAERGEVIFQKAM